MGNKHELENLMRSTMENLRSMIDVNTVIGEAVETKDGSYIIPISRVSFGFASGGGEYGNHTRSTNLDDGTRYQFGGGSGAGVSVRPVAFLVVKNDNVRLLPLDYDNSVDRIVDTIPTVLETIKNLFKDKSKSEEVHEDTKPKHNFEFNNVDSF